MDRQQVANYTGLSGKGIQALSPGTTLIDILPTTYPRRATIGEANPPNWYHIGLLRFGSSNFWQPAFPIDADNMWVPVPPGANEVGYSIMSGGIITIEETIAVPTIPNWQKQPWDRNPSVFGVTNVLNTGPTGSEQQLSTYTVPSGRIAELSTANLGAELVTTATQMSSAVILNVDGQDILRANLSIQSVGSHAESDFGGGPVYVVAGTVIKTMYYVSGGAAGVVAVGSSFAGTLFDA